MAMRAEERRRWGILSRLRCTKEIYYLPDGVADLYLDLAIPKGPAEFLLRDWVTVYTARQQA